MYLVFCEPNDISALWAYQGLKSRGLGPIELVTSEALAYSLRWEHRIGPRGASIEIDLADGRRISGDSTWGVLNRLQTIPSAHLRASAADREYAAQELFAFFMSWIYSLPRPVLNPPTPQGLSGRWRHASEWCLLASSAGLSTPHYGQSSLEGMNSAHSRGSLVPAGTPVNTVIVIDGHVVGASLPKDMAEGCRRLTELSRTPLLGIEFAASSVTPLTFAGATPLPDLRLGGQALLDVLAVALRGGREGPR